MNCARTGVVSPHCRFQFWRLLLGSLLLACVGLQARADSCPGSDTCPTAQWAARQGPNAAELHWVEPNLEDSALPGSYSVTTTPATSTWWFLSIAPFDPQDRLVFNLDPNIAYTFTICGWYDSANSSCVTTNSVPQWPQAGGPAYPTPSFTGTSIIGPSIRFAWSGGANYDEYLVIPNYQSQVTAAGGANGSYTLSPITPGNSYNLQVKGCYLAATSYCSNWATITVPTQAPPPPPPTGPQNLSAAIGPSGADIIVSWTSPPQEVIREWTVSPAPPATSTFSRGAASLDYFGLAPGQIYAFKVCLAYATVTTSACASVTAALPPACSITFSCPYHIYTPPDYQVSCSTTVDFYEQYPQGERVFLGTATTSSGTSSDYSTYVVGCAPGTQACTSQAIGVSPAGWCAQPPPPPPPPSPIPPPGGSGRKFGCVGICQ
jgi:hypothetical protein